MNIPCIKCNSEIYNYVRPYLLSWGYAFRITEHNWSRSPLLVINEGGYLGTCYNYKFDHCINFDRELVTDVEEFLEKAAELKGFTYKRKDIMKINGIEIKPGMVITTKDEGTYIAFPTNEGIAFTNNTYGGWQRSAPRDIIEIRDLSEGVTLNDGVVLWEQPKEIVISMDEIAEKFGYSVENIKIVK